jgi:glycerol-3-phosphate acyltransferase PlsY
MMATLLSVLLGYVLGAIPSAALAARLKGRQIFEVGSGNMGAMNTARNLGLALGIAVLIVDIGKGALASYLAMLAPWPMAAGYAAGVGAVVGHAWSIFVGFRGGKALATAFGVSLPLYPLGGLAALALLLTLIVLLRRHNLAATVTAALYPLIVWLVSLGTGAAPGAVLAATLSAALMAAVVIIKHLPALRRPEQPLF